MTDTGIYQIVNKRNGKRYIGSATSFAKRWAVHRRQLDRGIHHAPHLQSSWLKHGPDGFAFEVLELCDRQSLIAREQWWFEATSPEFNVCKTAGSTAGFVYSDASRRKISEALKGTKHAPRSAEYRAKLSAANAGKPKPVAVMEALQAGRKNTVFTDARRQAVSSALRAAYESGLRVREKTEAHKAKIGQAYAKLTDDAVREIRRLRAAGETCKALAAQFGSNAGTICEIATGKRYRWVE